MRLENKYPKKDQVEILVVGDMVCISIHDTKGGSSNYSNYHITRKSFDHFVKEYMDILLVEVD